MGERIGFGLYQSCRNWGSVGHMCAVSLDSLCRWREGIHNLYSGLPYLAEYFLVLSC